MDRVLGLLILAVYIVGIVGLAALITYGVIRIFPTERTPSKPSGDGSDDETKQKSSRDGESVGGRLYRRARRGAA